MLEGKCELILLVAYEEELLEEEDEKVPDSRNKVNSEAVKKVSFCFCRSGS